MSLFLRRELRLGRFRPEQCVSSTLHRKTLKSQDAVLRLPNRGFPASDAPLFRNNATSCSSVKRKFLDRFAKDATMGDMRNLFNLIANLTISRIVVNVAWLSFVLFYGWNFGVKKFFPLAPTVSVLDCMTLLGMAEMLLVYMIRPIHREFIPIPVYRPSGHPDEAEAAE